MDIQVLNEIANPARQASLSQAKPSVSTQAQLKALKGNPLFVPENLAPPVVEDSSNSVPEPVTPDISSVARAASAYSAVVGDGLNLDELSAIQDLAGRIRTAVSDFLSQPGLEQAESAETVLVSNPEVVQILASKVEQAVVDVLNVPAIESEAIANPSTQNSDFPDEIPVVENPISLERITNDAELNNPIVAANPEVVPAGVKENTVVENPINIEEVPESSRGDFRVSVASPVLQNAQSKNDGRAEAPVSREVVVSQQVPVGRAETPKFSSQEVPVSTNDPELISTASIENTQEGVPVIDTDPALQNAPVNGSITVSPNVIVPLQEESRRPESLEINTQQASASPVEPALQNTQTSENVRVEAPVSRSDAPTVNPQEAPVKVDSQALQSEQTKNVEVGNPASVATPPAEQGQRLQNPRAQTVDPEGAIAQPQGGNNQAESGLSNPQPVPSSQPVPAQPNDLFPQESAAVNPENIRNANELVGSVVANEFSSEAKKIFSEPKVIRTVADLADFILERLQEIITANQSQRPSQSADEAVIS